MTNKYKIIALMGESGSGKDYILKKILKSTNFNKIIQATTRPKREKENNGIDYYFYNVEQFEDAILKNQIIDYKMFNNWYYGTPIQTLKTEQINIGVFSPSAIEFLIYNPLFDVKVFKIETKDKIRLIRQLNREENPDVLEILRRFYADYSDFKNIEFNYHSVQNNSLSDSRTAVQIISTLGQF